VIAVLAWRWRRTSAAARPVRTDGDSVIDPRFARRLDEELALFNR
jgi:hypothetical protein